MGMIAVSSVKGSPGVTTTALLFAALWPRPILAVEADPSGGDIALRMPDPAGNPLDPWRGLVSLIAAGRRSLYPQLVREHAQSIVGGLDAVAGVSAPEQTLGINQWDELAQLLPRIPGSDVVADLGRVGAGTPQNALLATASAICVVTGTVPSQVVHLRERLRRMRESDPGLPPVYIAVVAPAKRSRAVREIREVLDQADAEVSGVFHLADDTVGADYFLGQVSGRPQRTHLVRSAQPVVAELADLTEAAFTPGDNPPDNPPGGDGAESQQGENRQNDTQPSDTNRSDEQQEEAP